MRKYWRIEMDSDPNVVHDLMAEDEMGALYEALAILGYNLVYSNDIVNRDDVKEDKNGKK